MMNKHYIEEAISSFREEFSSLFALSRSGGCPDYFEKDVETFISNLLKKQEIEIRKEIMKTQKYAYGCKHCYNNAKNISLSSKQEKGEKGDL